MTLWELQKNQTATVTQVADSVNSAVLYRLNEMGLDTNSVVKCIRRGPIGGPIVIQLGDSVFAIEHTLASHISVVVEPSSNKPASSKKD